MSGRGSPTDAKPAGRLDERQAVQDMEPQDVTVWRLERISQRSDQNPRFVSQRGAVGNGVLPSRTVERDRDETRRNTPAPDAPVDGITQPPPEMRQEVAPERDREAPSIDHAHEHEIRLLGDIVGIPGCATERAREPPDLGLERPIEAVTGCLIAGVGTFGDRLHDPLVRRINLIVGTKDRQQGWRRSLHSATRCHLTHCAPANAPGGRAKCSGSAGPMSISITARSRSDRSCNGAASRAARNWSRPRQRQHAQVAAALAGHPGVAPPLPAPVEDRLLVGDRWKGREWDLMFCSTIGTPLDPGNVTKRFRELLAEAGLEQRRFHDLRHSCGTFLAARNVHPLAIRQILGHSQLSTTMNIYTHTEMDSMRSALDSLEVRFDHEQRSS